ncbi:MAG: hypothetical protein M1818_004112 [Claussenomyces sp. TS43310]|nr:MAG: hypothetical protein M1818_004112 [Claussenomyces sp. TS43310]
MAKTGVVHHVGTLLIFATFLLLLVTTISSPVVRDVSILKVNLGNRTKSQSASVTFGTFGYCVFDGTPIKNKSTNTTKDLCSRRPLGYSPADVLDDKSLPSDRALVTRHLTRVMVLHPFLCGLAFIAFLLALGSGLVGALLASIICAITWAITLLVMACDFILFGIIKNNVNRDGRGDSATYGLAMWTILAAMILLFLATFIVLSTCLSARGHSRNFGVSKGEEVHYANGTSLQRQRFWRPQTRTAY